MEESIKELRKFFKSELWVNACFEDQPIISNNGLTGDDNSIVRLDTKINLALDFEGKFSEMAHQYNQWRKQQGLKYGE